MLNVRTARLIISETMRYAIGLDVTLGNHKKVVWTTFLLVVLAFSAVSVSFGLQSSSAISSSGMISYWPRVDITVNVSKVIGVNNLSLGFQLDWTRWVEFVNNPVLRQMAKDFNAKLARVFDFRSTSPRLMPCTYWSESTKTGTWEWTNVDSLTQRIFEIGAEPLFCLGWARDNIQNFIPTGMAVNPNTGLPYPESYAAYAKEWVRHFKTLGWGVRYYEIMNEPWTYFGWNPSDTTKLAYYTELWNAAARAMRSENPNILLSHDAITQKNVLNYWIQYGDNVDFLDFHKYDAGTIGECSDTEMFRRAEIYRFETTTSTYGVNEVRQKWLNARGKLLPVINSESNFNSAWESGTDPKIQQMAGAVWLALLLRMGILKGLNSYVYFEFASSKSWQESHGTGWGFGMINEDDDQPWYPYYVHKMIGSNIAVGDKLVHTQSSSEDIRSIAWINNGMLNILLVCKVNEPRTIVLQGINGQLNFSRVDNTVPYETPSIQADKITTNKTLSMQGYSVALLQMSAFH